MTIRRLKILIAGLPSHSLYKARLRGITDGQRWGDETYLLAFIADMLQAQYGVAYVGVTNKQPPQMTPYPRPETEADVARRAEEAQANNRADAYLELLSSGVLEGQQATRQISGTAAPGQVPRSLPSAEQPSQEARPPTE
ncbi:hypothetical protein ACFW6C_09250 [Streptomyces fungicidicus]|uniref:hypothetical protein n=1 Tax=Streptomyces fungicidicus TaxID=68203 RepID=UPI003325397E